MTQNGLRTFAFHTHDESSAETVRALRAERPSSATFAARVAAGLSNLDEADGLGQGTALFRRAGRG
jgi:hypothetical protein